MASLKLIQELFMLTCMGTFVASITFAGVALLD
jgi:hypothetical protein